MWHVVDHASRFLALWTIDYVIYIVDALYIRQKKMGRSPKRVVDVNKQTCLQNVILSQRL